MSISGAGHDGEAATADWSPVGSVDGAALEEGTAGADGATADAAIGSNATRTARARSVDLAGLGLEEQLRARLEETEDGTSDAPTIDPEVLKNAPGDGHFDRLKPGETRTYAWGTAHLDEDGTLELQARGESAEALAQLKRDVGGIGPDATRRALWRTRPRPGLTAVEEALVRFGGALTIPFAIASDVLEAAVSPLIVGYDTTKLLIERGKEAKRMTPEEMAAWKKARKATRKLERAEDRVDALEWRQEHAVDEGKTGKEERLAHRTEKAQTRLDGLPRDMDG